MGAIEIIMIEDDEGHATLIQRNIRRAGVMNEIHHFADGQSALDHLFDGDKMSKAVVGKHLLFLLDLNLPDMTGIDVLTRIKGDEIMQRSPIIVLTTTDDAEEIQRCYDLGANAYITKPVVYEGLAEKIRQLGLFFTIMQVPPLDA